MPGSTHWMSRRTLRGALVLVGLLAITGCGKANLHAPRRAGELSTAEKIDNLCFDLVSQLKAAIYQAVQGGRPPVGGRGLQEEVSLGEKYSLEQGALSSAPLMLSILHEVQEVPVPSFARASDAAFERALETGAVGFRLFAQRLHGEPPHPREYAHYAAASVAPARPALTNCHETVGLLSRRHE
jgi:hypothetical protein